ncbi:hypothetical protein D1872_280160 [compost metagenome]
MGDFLTECQTEPTAVFEVLQVGMRLHKGGEEVLKPRFFDTDATIPNRQTVAISLIGKV